MTPATSPQRPSGALPTPAKRPRDPRLDFFRGMAMFIILLAHTFDDSWALWIPARFGFSDATEIFVFCSGMASSIAFGTVFVKRGWWLGTARIAFRVWQVYWAHIGIFLTTVMLCFAIDHFGIGLPGKQYITEPYVVPFFTRTGEAMLGLMTLTYVPGMFDILPMYLVILAMIPAVMMLYRLGGRWAVFGAAVALWLAANIAGYARSFEPEADPAAWETLVYNLGMAFSFLNLPSDPFGSGSWFFDPFAWQLVFFTGFAFGMGWLPAPPVKRWLIWAAAIYVILVVPFAWHKIHEGQYLPMGWTLQVWIHDARMATEPLWWKSWVGAARYLHFIALAYLAWAAVGPGGQWLSSGYKAPRAAPLWVLPVAAVVAVASAPYAYVDQIKALSPALDAWLLRNIPIVHGDRIGLVQIAHLLALIVLAWSVIGARGREWLTRDLVTMSVPVIRKVGTQSLAVFMVSIPLARFNAWVLDMIGRDAWTVGAVNLWGFAVLVAVAYMVSWFKGTPWRSMAPVRISAADAAPHSGEGRSGADGRGGARIAAMRA